MRAVRAIGKANENRDLASVTISEHENNCCWCGGGCFLVETSKK